MENNPKFVYVAPRNHNHTAQQKLETRHKKKKKIPNCYYPSHTACNWGSFAPYWAICRKTFKTHCIVVIAKVFLPVFEFPFPLLEECNWVFRSVQSILQSWQFFIYFFAKRVIKWYMKILEHSKNGFGHNCHFVQNLSITNSNSKYELLSYLE